MKYFKGLIAGILASSMLIGFAGCTGSQGTENGTADSSTEKSSEPSIKLTEEQIALYAAYSTENAKRALEIALATVDNYIDPMSYKKTDTVVLAESCTVSPNQDRFARNGVASVWHYTAFWAMQSKMLPLTTGEANSYFSELYQNTYKSMSYYEGTGNVTTYMGTDTYSMYAVNRSGSSGGADISGINAVYDDQMWIIRELIYGYEQTGSQLYLEQAERLTKVCLDGWDVTKDEKGNEIGGICWGPGYATKHTCSNGPLILPLVELSEIYTSLGDAEKAAYYLEWAVKVYEFCVKYFTLGAVYGDFVGSSREAEGSAKNRHYVTTSQSTSPDKATYTYNTGTIVSGAAALYRVTGEEKYLRTATRNAKGALNHFTQVYPDPDNKDTEYRLWPSDAQIWFNLIMLEGYLELYEFAPEICLEAINTFQTSLDYAYEHHAKNGFLPAHYIYGWDRKNSKDNNKNVMDQATAAHIYAVLAEFYARLVAEQSQ